MNEKLKYKIGDVVIINNDPGFNSWVNQKVVITGFTNNPGYPYYVKKLNGSQETGAIKEDWCHPSTREIKVFDDD